jgi:hypothetical protein
VETVESQTAGFPPFPRTLGNRKGGDFHIPTAPATVAFSRQNQKQRPNMGTVEKWKSKIGISTFPPSRSACGARKNSGLIVGKNG